MRESWSDGLRLLHHSARTVGGRWFWVAPLLPLLWIVIQYLNVRLGLRETSFDVENAQNLLIGFPLTLLAIGLGVRVIAGEIDRRTLEIAYTVPGGAHRIWLSKLAAAALLLLAADLLLGLATFVFCTAFPPSTLYGAFQPAMFFLVLSMGIAALFKSEAVGAMVTAGVLTLALMLSTTRVSPFFNPEFLGDLESIERLARVVQNRIGYLLATLAVCVLAFGRAEQRERMLGG